MRNIVGGQRMCDRYDAVVCVIGTKMGQEAPVQGAVSAAKITAVGAPSGSGFTVCLDATWLLGDIQTCSTVDSPDVAAAIR
jgi:hypothetical protein